MQKSFMRDNGIASTGVITKEKSGRLPGDGLLIIIIS